MSNIQFKKVVLQNFMSYEYAEVQLNKPGYILVTGENLNPEDAAKSNGCGKSTIFNAICWALTGNTVSGFKNVANIYIKGETFVELSFSCNDNNYVIKRIAKPSKLKLWVNDKDVSGKGIRDTEKLLTEYLPDVTNSLINSVIILGQGLPQRFTNNTPSGRKEVLENLSKSDFMIEDIKQRLKERRERLSEGLQEYQEKEVKNSTNIHWLNKEIEDDTAKIDELQKYSDIEEEIENLENDLFAAKSSKLELFTLIEELEKSKTEHEELIQKITEERQQEIDALVIEDEDELSSKVNKYEYEIQAKEKEIKKLDAVTDVCPTCGQKLPDVTKIDTSEMKQELNELRHEWESNHNKLQEIRARNEHKLIDIDDKYNQSQAKIYDNIESIVEEIKENKKQIGDYDEKILQITSELSSKKTASEHYTDMIEELVSNIAKNKKKLEEITADNIVINNKLDYINSHLEINSKMATIVKRDFRGYLLTNVIEFISMRCKYYSQEVFGTENFNFKLDGNNISISYDNKEYESLSGGEKQKVDIIVQFSIRDMLCNYLNFSSNILVLDEITDSLDIVGAQKVFNLISHNLNDVETIYIISHHTDFEIPYDDEIKIIKGVDKISRIT